MPSLTNLAVNNRADVPKTIDRQFRIQSYIQEPTSVKPASIPKSKIVPEEVRGLEVNKNA